MQLPFKGQFKISQTFGNVLILDGKDVYAQWGLKGHNGIDFATPDGTALYAPHSGKALEISNDVNGYGWYIKLENSSEGSVLAHLSRVLINLNANVKEGDLIGYTGNTGFSTGAHLHWGYYKLPRNRNNGYNGFIDQMPYIAKLIEEGYTAKLPVGFIIRPAIDIPVGEKPGQETFEYGRISKDAPATITSVRTVNNEDYYNISQLDIGGGTGWVLAEQVDTAPAYVEPKKEEPKKEEPVVTKPKVEDSITLTKNEYTKLLSYKDVADRYEAEIKEYSRVGEVYDFTTPRQLDTLLTDNLKVMTYLRAKLAIAERKTDNTKVEVTTEKVDYKKIQNLFETSLNKALQSELFKYKEVGTKHGFTTPKQLEKTLDTIKNKFKSFDSKELDKLFTVVKAEEELKKQPVVRNVTWLVNLLGLSSFIKGGDKDGR